MPTSSQVTLLENRNLPNNPHPSRKRDSITRLRRYAPKPPGNLPAGWTGRTTSGSPVVQRIAESASSCHRKTTPAEQQRAKSVILSRRSTSTCRTLGPKTLPEVQFASQTSDRGWAQKESSTIADFTRRFFLCPKSRLSSNTTSACFASATENVREIAACHSR